MVSKAIIHIGMHKTGSSSIQSSLSNYDDGEIFYAQFPEHNHSIPIYTAFSTDYLSYPVWNKVGLKPSEIENKRLEYRKGLQENLLREDRKEVIISGEDISLLDNLGKADFINFVLSIVPNIVVFCYVRAPIAWAASNFQQNVQGGMRNIPENFDPRFRYRLEQFQSALKNHSIIVSEFNTKKFPEGSVVKDFSTRFGLNYSLIRESRANESLSLPALKLTFLFNKTCPCHSGDAITYSAKKSLIKEIQGAYKSYPKVDAKFFQGASDFTDCAYLEDEYGLHFEKPSDLCSVGYADLCDYIENMQDFDIAPLKALLTSKSIDTRSSEPAYLVNRLYLHHVISEGIKRSSKENVLKSSDADMLRDCALSYQANRPLVVDEAISLMQLAARARPEGKIIQGKLAEWADLEKS